MINILILLCLSCFSFLSLALPIELTEDKKVSILSLNSHDKVIVFKKVEILDGNMTPVFYIDTPKGILNIKLQSGSFHIKGYSGQEFEISSFDVKTHMNSVIEQSNELLIESINTAIGYYDDIVFEGDDKWLGNLKENIKSNHITSLYSSNNTCQVFKKALTIALSSSVLMLHDASLSGNEVRLREGLKSFLLSIMIKGSYKNKCLTIRA